MSDDWYPEAIVDPGNNAGSYTDNGESKGLLHTTEGKSYAGARGAYVANNSWPHSTATYENNFFQIYQHNSIFMAARALKNLSGGVETNRDRVAQLEMVGTSNINNAASWGPQYVENFPIPYLDGIARWMRWVEQTLGVPRQSTVTWKSYPSSYGTSNGIRLSASQFDAYTGWLGHQHAAENTHGDPGLINITYLLTPTVPVPPPIIIPEIDPMQDYLIRHTSSATRYWLRGDKMFYLPTSADITSLATILDENILDVSSELLNFLRTTYEVVD